MTDLKRKIKKRERINRALDGLRTTPKTCMQMRKEYGESHSYYTHTMAFLSELGYVIKVGEINRNNLWQAVKFDYRELGVDYDDEVATEKVVNTLADAHYIHNPNLYADKYRDTDKLVRTNRQYTKIHVGISPIYNNA